MTAPLCDDLQRFQRDRNMFRKSRIMFENRLVATIAASLGYESRMDEADRLAKFAEARRIIDGIRDGESHPLSALVLTTSLAIDGFSDKESEIEKWMVKLAKQLPVAEWVAQEEQRGFGMPSLATVIGETGDLSQYANPAKVWKRMGCAPFSKGEKTLMGATWKGGRQGALSAAEWEEFGYSPRRRSVAYVIGENLIKGNFRKAAGDGGDVFPDTDTACRNPGPYRLRYDETKAKLQADHPDYPKLRCHRHGMLLATKLLLKNLWVEWQRCHSPTDAECELALAAS